MQGKQRKRTREEAFSVEYKDMWMQSIFQDMLEPGTIQEQRKLRQLTSAETDDNIVASSNNTHMDSTIDLTPDVKAVEVELEKVVSRHAGRPQTLHGMLELLVKMSRPYALVVDSIRADKFSEVGFSDGVHHKMQDILRIMHEADGRKGVKNVDDISQTSSLKRFMSKFHQDVFSLPPTLFLTGIVFPTLSPSAGGAFSDVFRARYNESIVAVKRLRIFNRVEHRLLADLYKKVKNWHKLSHPNILILLGLDDNTFKADTIPCLVYRWMSRGDIISCIRNLKKESKAVPVESWTYETASGLCYLHDKGFIHGDLRGANVLVDEDYRIHVSDIGISHFASRTTSTTLGNVDYEGTIRWLAPEILKLDSPPTCPADVYSFGCVCLEIFGRKPYHDVQDRQVIMAKLNDKTPEWPEVDDATSFEAKLRRLILPCWHSNPDSRPTMAALEKELYALTRK